MSSNSARLSLAKLTNRLGQLRHRFLGDGSVQRVSIDLIQWNHSNLFDPLDSIGDRSLEIDRRFRGNGFACRIGGLRFLRSFWCDGCAHLVSHCAVNVRVFVSNTGFANDFRLDGFAFFLRNFSRLESLDRCDPCSIMSNRSTGNGLRYAACRALIDSCRIASCILASILRLRSRWKSMCDRINHACFHGDTLEQRDRPLNPAVHHERHSACVRFLRMSNHTACVAATSGELACTHSARPGKATYSRFKKLRIRIVTFPFQ